MTALLASALLAVMTPSAIAASTHADFPRKPVRIIAPFNAGSGSDENSRVYGELLGKQLGTRVIIENRPGGSGRVAIQALKAAPADGYTMLLASNSPMAVNPVVYKDLEYDPFKDFMPVYGTLLGAAAVVVRADSPYRSMAELVAAAKKDRQVLSIGNYSEGYQLIAAWVGTAANIGVTHVPYKGGAQMVTDLIGGNLDLGINDFGGIAPMLQDGRVRVLAVTGGQREKKYPDIPTMIESGFPGFETYVWASFYVKTGTPEAIVQKLADGMAAVMKSPEALAYQDARPGGPLLLAREQLAEFQRREYERFKAVAEAAGIKPQ